MLMPKPKNDWSWGEDQIPATSRRLKHWTGENCLSWFLEVRTEDLGAGTVRLGQVLVKGIGPTGQLTLSILDE